MLSLYTIPSKFCQSRVFNKTSISSCLSYKIQTRVELARHFFPTPLTNFQSRSLYTNPTPLNFGSGGVFLQLPTQNLHSSLTHFKRISSNFVLNKKSNLGLLLLAVSGAILILLSKAKAEEVVKVVFVEESPVIIKSSLKRRIWAYLLDIVFALLVPFIFAFLGNSSLIILLIQLYYYSQSKTLGKAIIGLHVVDKKTGKPATLPYMILHEFVKYLSVLVLFIDVFWYYFNDDCLHNVICDTVTVEDRKMIVVVPERVGGSHTD